MAGPKPLTRPKAPARVCRDGHLQRLSWRPGDPCESCIRREAAAALNDPAVAARFRAEQLAEVGELPASFTMRSGDGKSSLSFSARPSRRRR